MDHNAVCLFFMRAPLFISKAHTGNWLPATFPRRWCVVTSRSSGRADELSNVTRRMWPHGTQVIFFFVFRIYRVPETIFPTHQVGIIHLGGSCLWLVPSGVKWQAGSSGGAEQVSDTPGRRWRAKDSCAARSWWWATRSVARRRSSTSLPRTRIQRWGGFIQLRRGFRVTHGSHWN